MSFSYSKFLIHFPPPGEVGSNEPLVNVPTFTIPSITKAFLPIQVRSKEQKLQIQENITGVTRRQMMCSTAASFSGITLLYSEPSEARVRKPEVRRKIMEKLEMERRKAALSSKQRDNGSEKTSTPQLKEREPSLPSFPDLQAKQAESLVEASA